MPGCLAGKIVLIPGGLTGTGRFGVQMVKNYFKVGKVITMLSFSKMQVGINLLGAGVIDQAIEYTQGSASIIRQIGKVTVDCTFDTARQTTALVSTLQPKSRISFYST